MLINHSSSFGDPTRWQVALDPHAGTFSCLAAGSRIGLVAESAVSGNAATGSEMLVWQATHEGMRVATESFRGFEDAEVDILIAADEVALASLRASLDGDLLRDLRSQIRDGHILFFARKARRSLEDAGYEDLLDQLGFAFMGVCR